MNNDNAKRDGWWWGWGRVRVRLFVCVCGLWDGGGDVGMVIENECERRRVRKALGIMIF